MELLTQKAGEHKCLIYCAAMILEREVEWVEAGLGVKSQEVWWPGLPIPKCFRGVHIQELQDLFMYHGFALALLELRPYLGADPEHCKPVLQEDVTNRIIKRLRGCKAIIIEHNHAVAFHDTYVFDPNGKIFEIFKEYIMTRVREVWVLTYL